MSATQLQPVRRKGGCGSALAFCRSFSPAASCIQDGGAAWYEMPRGGRVGWVRACTGASTGCGPARAAAGGGHGGGRRTRCQDGGGASVAGLGHRTGEEQRKQTKTLNPQPPSDSSTFVCTSSLPVQLTN